MTRSRDYVAPEDVEALLLPLLGHRLELAPGIDDPAPILADCAAPILERLARHSLKRAVG